MAKDSTNKKKEVELRKVLAKGKAAKKEVAQAAKKPAVSPAAAAAAATAKRRAIRAQQAAKKTQQEAQQAKKGQSKQKTSVSSDESNPNEPPFSYEIHHKNKTITVFVTLHKVPPATIDVQSTTPSTLIVHTEKFTKKWRLVFPFPEGLLVDNEKGDYTYEDGVLKCVLPIKGTIPSSIVQQREKLFESFRSQKNLRFRTTQEGALVVRSRRATLTAESGKEKKDSKSKQGAASGTASTAAGSTAAVPAAATQATSAKNDDKKQVTLVAPSKAKLAQPKASATASSSTSKPTAGSAASAPKSAKKAEVADGSAMIKLAEAAGKASRNKFAERLKKEKELLKRRQEALGKKTVKLSTKKERDQSTFERIVAEQKAQLQAQIQLAAKPTRQPQAKNIGKTVKFQ